LLPRRSAAPGLAELGWEVRRSLPGLASPIREELAALAGDLFAASRIVGDTDLFLAGVERKVLLRLLTEHQELAVLSRRAEHEVETIARQLVELDELIAVRGELDEIAAAVRAQLPVPASIGELRARVREAGERLEAALPTARDDIGTKAAHLRRTPWRGVYRHANRYIVPLYDEVGIERVRRFELSRDARAFARAERIKAKRQKDPIRWAR
jgi:hypothetical protein